MKKSKRYNKKQLLYFSIMIFIIFCFVELILSKEIHFNLLNYLFITTILLLQHVILKNNKEIISVKNNYLDTNIEGLYNSDKLHLDLKSLNKKKNNYHIAIIKMVNLNELNKYYDFDIIHNIVNHLIKIIYEVNQDFNIYSISQNKIIIIKKKTSLNKFKIDLNNILNKMNIPIKSQNKIINLNIKIGILNQKDIYTFKPIEIFKKLLISIDQGNLLKSGLYIYDNEFANERKLYNEIANSLYQAINEDELYLVYQPIIDIKKEKISSCETLVRWDRGDKQPIGPNIFIKIAEDIGLIQFITKWVTKHALNDYIKWKENKCYIKQSINVTANELLDDKFLSWAYSLFDKYQQNPNNFGIEITERVLSKDNKKLNKILLELQNKGFMIEIDDFGTGYNSLMLLGEIHSNVIKIDKYFIDKIYENEMKIIIEKIIIAVHQIGSVVIAEGVEHKEQYKILKEIGCDKIQGYYFSKPLKSNDFIEYYKNFNFEDYI